eukprot:m.230043 g.230043  ORF g.230043 m.230043 type:complete len:313 (-) comp17896_c0_seq1:21-959(-)
MAQEFSTGNALYESGNFEAAVEAYNEAINKDDTNTLYLLRRALAQAALNRNTECSMDLRSAFQANAAEATAILDKEAETFRQAAFQATLKSVLEGLAAPAPLGAAAAASAPVPAAAAAAVPALKQDWYQSDKVTVITIFAKGCKLENIKCAYEPRSLKTEITLPSGVVHSLSFHLWGEIVPAESSFVPMSTKIEFKMKKAQPVQWQSLEGDGSHVPATLMAAPETIHVAKPKNWDKLAEEEIKKQGEDKPEGDAALNELFKKIYADGSDDVRRAMMKSYSESGGTVLSTNWSEIAAKRTEIKPPTGMEFKKY